MELEEETKDPESLSNHLRDFYDTNDQDPLLPCEAPLDIANDQESPDQPCPLSTAGPLEYMYVHQLFAKHSSHQAL